MAPAAVLDLRCSRGPARGAIAAHGTRRALAPAPVRLPARRPAAALGRQRQVCRASAGVAWHTAKVARSAPAAEGLRTLLLEVPAAVAAGYRVPGQYLQVRVKEADKPAFIAVASPVSTPAGTTLELLIKGTPGTADLCALPIGAALQVSDAQGKGFQLGALSPACAFPEVFLFATGSGISPIRALLNTPADAGGLGGGAGRSGVRLFYGARSEDHLAFKDELRAWERAGIHVTTVLSQQGGQQKYVQDAFAALALQLDPARTGAVLVGQKGMAEAVTATLTAAGVPRERILMNF